ncbi:pilus assembly protein [Marinobacteraceae bacterium S3BR75-40.1]
MNQFVLPLPCSQRGAALLTTLLILLVLSLLAISSMQGSLMQEKMVSAVRDGQVALEAAEFAAREAESRIENETVTIGDFGVAQGLYDQGDAPDEFAATTWDSSKTNSAAATGFTSGVLAESPRYFIEYMGEMSAEETDQGQISNYSANTGVGTPAGFRIVAWSSGRSGETRRIVQVYYGKAF